MPMTLGAGTDQGKRLPLPRRMESSAQHLKRMLNDLNGSSRRWKTPQLEAFIREHAGEASTALIKRIQVASKSYQEHLRDHVDLWLGTGRSAEGDTPANRKPNSTIHSIVERVFETHRAVPILLHDGYAATTMVGDVPSAEGLEAAELMFVDMLLSDWRFKLAKCPRCKRYFVVRHVRHAYKDGTVCARCVPRLKNDRARRLTGEMREGAEEDLYMKAASRFWPQIAGHPDWYKSRELKGKIAKFLSSEIVRDERLRRRYRGGGVTEKWLSWDKNRSGIEIKAKEIARARHGSV